MQHTGGQINSPGASDKQFPCTQLVFSATLKQSVQLMLQKAKPLPEIHGYTEQDKNV